MVFLGTSRALLVEQSDGCPSHSLLEFPRRAANLHGGKGNAMPAEYLQGSGFFCLSNDPLLSVDMPDRAFRLYAYLAMRAGAGGQSWPSKATIANDLGKSTDWVSRALRELRSGGWLICKKRTRKNHSQASNLYILNSGAPVNDVEHIRNRGADVIRGRGADSIPLELDTDRTPNHQMSTSDDRQNGTNWTMVTSIWNQLAHCYGLRQIRLMTDARKGLYLSRLRENPDYWEDLKGALSNLGEFARDKGFVTLDFCLRASGYTKLIEGNYAGDIPVPEVSEEDVELEKLLNPGPREGYAR